jgi:hypothetical protein
VRESYTSGNTGGVRYSASSSIVPTGGGKV